jgi:inner membrane protein
VDLVSNWRHPSFSGAWLPAEREVRGEGFTATWLVPFLGRGYPQAWTRVDEPYDRIVASRFGATLVLPVDHYRMSERSTKYASLFLILTFALLWPFGALTGVCVHPIQYLLVGGAMCVFYLLQLSLAEHVGFVAAYILAAFGVVGLVATYTKAVLRSATRGAVVGGSLGLLYAYLLALLSLERYALLAGSLGIFVFLAAVMHLTRWIDWRTLAHAESVPRARGVRSLQGGGGRTEPSRRIVVAPGAIDASTCVERQGRKTGALEADPARSSLLVPVSEPVV